MMPWRAGLVVACGLLVGGCFLSAYQIASWTATGVSYVFSGKGVGDHAISLAMNQDCATLRVLKGKKICVDYKGEHKDTWSAMASTWKMPDPDNSDQIDFSVGGEDDPINEPLAAPVVALAADSLDIAPATGPIVDSDLRNIQIVSDRTASEKPIRGVDFDGLVVPEWAVGKRRETPWQSQAFAPRGMDFGGLMLIDRKATRAEAKAPTVLAGAVGEPAIYLVMGSFRDEKNAKRLGAEHAGLKTTISKTVSDGRTLYRLLAGSIDKAALSGVRVGLAKAGIRNSWAVRLCRGSFAIPPCKPVLQQAALPYTNER